MRIDCPGKMPFLGITEKCFENAGTAASPNALESTAAFSSSLIEAVSVISRSGIFPDSFARRQNVHGVQGGVAKLSAQILHLCEELKNVVRRYLDAVKTRR